MHIVNMKGKTVDEAIKSALEVLKMTREQVDVRVIDEGESGVLGVFGGRDAQIEAKAKLDPAEEARQVLQEIIDKTGFFDNVYVLDKQNDVVILEIKGEDIPRIIGKEGQTIDALQYLVGIIVNRGKEKRTQIIVDAGGYRKKQEKRVENIAKEAAEEALASGKEIELPPMNSRERRIVHMTIKNMGRLVSQSTGERSNRRVIISPSG